MSATTATVLDRMVAAGINQERAEGLIRAGAITIDGEPVADPGQEAPWPSRITARST